MGQVLHGSATTTHAIRAAIQRSTAPLKELAAHYGRNQKAVAKWRKRAFVHDAPMEPKVVRSTVLTVEEEVGNDQEFGLKVNLSFRAVFQAVAFSNNAEIAKIYVYSEG